MKRLFITIVCVLCCVLAMAQNLSQFKTLEDSRFADDKSYISANKYQRDAILFVDMLADTHPYYIEKSRRDDLYSKMDDLLKACADCKSDTEFVELLGKTLGELRDKHTDIMDMESFLSSQKKKAEKVEALQNSAKTSNAIMENKGDLFHYTIDKKNSICYLQFNQCQDARTAGDESLPRWDEMLENMFSEIKTQGIKTLVVDAQYNNGGSSMLCDELLIHLYPYEKLKTLSTSLRFSRLTAAYNPRIGTAQQAWEADGHIDELYPMPAGKVGPGFVQPEVFSGKVIFVQGEKTYSSAGILMTLARDNHIGIIVGSESTFPPSHYGEVLPFRLPNTDVIGTVCTKFFARPDTDHLYDKTLVPDVKIDLSNKQKAWKKILKLAK